MAELAALAGDDRVLEARALGEEEDLLRPAPSGAARARPSGPAPSTAAPAARSIWRRFSDDDMVRVSALSRSGLAARRRARGQDQGGPTILPGFRPGARGIGRRGIAIGRSAGLVSRRGQRASSSSRPGNGIEGRASPASRRPAGGEQVFDHGQAAGERDVVPVEGVNGLELLVELVLAAAEVADRLGERRELNDPRLDLGVQSPVVVAEAREVGREPLGPSGAGRRRASRPSRAGRGATVSRPGPSMARRVRPSVEPQVVGSRSVRLQDRQRRLGQSSRVSAESIRASASSCQASSRRPDVGVRPARPVGPACARTATFHSAASSRVAGSNRSTRVDQRLGAVEPGDDAVEDLDQPDEHRAEEPAQAAAGGHEDGPGPSRVRSRRHKSSRSRTVLGLDGRRQGLLHEDVGKLLGEDGQPVRLVGGPGAGPRAGPRRRPGRARSGAEGVDVEVAPDGRLAPAGDRFEVDRAVEDLAEGVGERPPASRADLQAVDPVDQPLGRPATPVDHRHAPAPSASSGANPNGSSGRPGNAKTS